MNYWVGFAAVLGVLVATVSAQQGRVDAPLLILLSFDGWRWDYDARFAAPAVRRVISSGVRSEGLIPSFPSKTFPNLYTLVTGLYPGRHGIVANSILDRGSGRRFSLSNRQEVQDPLWWGGEPLWVAIERAGRPTAALFWPGSEAPIHGTRPTFWMEFNKSLPGTMRVDRALALLDQASDRRPAFVALYFEDVDSAAHAFGPESRATRDAVGRVDGYLARLLAGLERRDLLDKTNIVLTSDHGLSATSPDRVVVLDHYISLDDIEIVDLNPTLGVFPRPGREAAVYRALSAAHPRLKVYRRVDTPSHWHYRAHERIPPIVGVVDDGWQIVRRATVFDRAVRRIIGPRGHHGYDPATSQSMHGLFAAMGPSFCSGLTVPAFGNVHLYNVLAAAAGVQPAPNDGDPAWVQKLLRPAPASGGQGCAGAPQARYTPRTMLPFIRAQ